MGQFIVNTTNTNECLTLFFRGEINSSTSPDVEKEVFAILKTGKPKMVALNLGEVTYLSSAGLRVILKIKQACDNVRIDDALPDVYDVLSMTGFTNIIEVRRALKSVDVTGCEIVGEGYFSTVYRLDKDTIVKVFRRQTELKEVERELNMAKRAFILGIPTAISFDVVKVEDKYGVRFELLDSVSLRDLFRDHPERHNELVGKYANLLKKINSTESGDPNLPKVGASYIDICDFIDKYLDKADSAKLKKMVEDIPERTTFVHGDCHFKNIMLQNDELLLIDMDTLAQGNPVFELSAIFCTYIAFEEDDPGNCMRFLGIDTENTFRIFYDTLDAYLGGHDETKIAKIRALAYAHMLWWNKMNEPENTKRFEGIKERLIPLIRSLDNLDIGL